MKIILTICSANYLAHARTLGDSLRESNPDIHFVVGLMDRVPAGFKTAEWLPMEIFPVEDLAIPEFADMEQRYDIVELNTAVKPFYMEHLYRRDPAVDMVMYLDPDILVLGSFKVLLDKLKNCNLIVTPHNSTYDNSKVNLYYEIGMLNTGIYNLGFIATARGETTFAFLKWWQTRLITHCYYRVGSGMFVDQLWVTLAPLYFPGVYVEKDPGYNMCYWNHFERRLSRRDGRYFVNEQHELIFYHFSSYRPLNPDSMSGRPGEPTMTFAERPEMRPLYDSYRDKLMAAGYLAFKPIECVFGRKPKPPVKPKLTPKRVVKLGVQKSLRALPALVRRPLKRVTQFIANNS